MKAILDTLKHKWAEYILEILVIIIGILGAFALDNWNKRIIDQEAQREAIQKLVGDLEHDIDQFKIFLLGRIVQNVTESEVSSELRSQIAPTD